jgi:hypothetical protein
MSNPKPGDRAHRKDMFKRPQEATLVSAHYSAAVGMTVWRVNLDSGMISWWNEGDFEVRPGFLHLDYHVDV